MAQPELTQALEQGTRNLTSKHSSITEFYEILNKINTAKSVDQIFDSLVNFDVMLQAGHYAFYVEEDIGEAHAFWSELLSHPHTLYQAIHPLVSDTIYIPDATNASSWSELASFVQPEPLRSVILIPLDIYHGRAEGLLLFAHPEPNVFTQTQLEQAKVIGAHITNVLTSLLVLQEAETSLEEAQILITASRALSGSTRLEDVYKAMGQVFLSTGADKVTLAMYLEHLSDSRPTHVILVDISGPAATEEDQKNIGYVINISAMWPPTEDAKDASNILNQADMPALLRFPYLFAGQTTGRITTISDVKNDPNLNNNERELLNRFRIQAQANVPLFSKGVPFGFVLVEYMQPHVFSNRNLALLRTIANQTTVAIEQCRQLDSTQRRAQQIQTGADISRVANSILKHETLIEDAVNLIRTGFDLYYVGLFMVDDAGEWAVLQAGSGKAGQAQVSEGHKLALNEESMIGWCISHKEARINLDVGEGAVRFDNPHLPETRSEMALSLISRGIVLGAISIQSTEPAAFSQEDIVSLQTMADQIANALLNSRLFENTQKVQLQTDGLYQMSRQIAVAEDKFEAATLAIRYVPKGVFENVSLSLLEEPGKPEASTIEVVAMWDINGIEDKYLHRRFTVEELPIIDVAKTHEVIVIEDIDDHPLVDKATHETYQSLGIKRAVIVPVRVDGVILGWLTATTSEAGRPFAPADFTPLQAVVDQISVVMDRIRKADSLKKASREYQTMVDNIPGAVYRAELKRDYCFQFVSRDIIDITGYPIAEFLDDERELFLEIIHSEDRDRVQTIHRNQVNQPEPYQIQYRITTKSGESRYISEHGQGTFDDAGNLLYIDGVFFDITESETLQRAFQRRAAQFEAIAEVGQATSAILDVNLLMANTVDQITETFGFYYAGLFLVDRHKEWATLRAGSGEAGQKMLSENHRLKCDETSMVGWATYHGQARIALDVGEEPHRFDNPHLPLTRSEIALPLIARGRVIGALDVQSEYQNAFTPDDITTLQLMANQLANATENATLFETTQQNLRETDHLYQTTQALIKAKTEEALFDAFIEKMSELGADSVSVSKFLEQGDVYFLEVMSIWSRHDTSFSKGDLINVDDFFLKPLIMQTETIVIQNVQTDDRLSDDMKERLHQLDVYSMLIIPMIVQSLVGTIHITYKKQPRLYSEGQIRLFESMVQQLGIIWQNLQLLTSIERRYRREQIIREVTGKIHAATGIDQILQTTVSELTKALNVSAGAARLKVGQEDLNSH